MAIGDYWEWIALGIDLSVAALFYKLYCDKTKDAEDIRALSVYSIDQELVDCLKCQDPPVLPYACVQGPVAPLRATNILRSRFGDDVGVIRHTLQTEHKSKRESGYWNDVKRVIKDYYDKVPFVLTRASGGTTQVRIQEPLEAAYLKDDLNITYDRFEKTERGLLSQGLDRIFGDVTKGFQETERMLPVGTVLLGIGRLAVEDGNICLEPPLDSRRYILTTMNKKELIKSLESSARLLRLFGWLFRAVAVGLVSFWMYRQIKKWWAHRESRRVYEEIRARTQSLQQEGTTGEEAPEERTACVICLVNRRNVVLLQCGHICLCVDCAEALPAPKTCPICRADVHSVLPTFIA